MEEESNKTGPSKAQSSKECISELEHRYIQLLESKVLSLEQQLITMSTKDQDSTSEKSSEALDEDREQKADHSGDELASVDDEKKQEPRYPVVIRKWDPGSGRFTDTDASVPEDIIEMGPVNQSHRAFTFRKISMSAPHLRGVGRTETVSSEVEIEFKPLQALLGNITSRFGFFDFVTNLQSPYSSLVYSWEEATRESQKVIDDESDDQKQARTDLRELLRLISTSSGHIQLDRYFKDRKKFTEKGTITYDALWTLFPPGSLMVARPFLDQPQVFSVKSCDGFVDGKEAFELICYCFDWNGYEFNRVPFKMAIPHWGEDRKSIIELPFYPLQYHVDASVGEDNTQEDAVAKLRKTLVDRGKKYQRLCTMEKGKQMFKYDGPALFHSGRSLLLRTYSSGGEQNEQLDEQSSSASSGDIGSGTDKSYISKKQVHGTTMVDFASFFEYLPPKTPILGPLRPHEAQLESLTLEGRHNPVFREIYKLDWDRHPRDRSMQDDQYLLCPPRVLGYVLKQKQWAQLLVDCLEEPDKADASTFKEKLQLDEESKELVQKSVQAHEYGKKNSAGVIRALEDFAPDKGKGLVVMLYGYPGVGKTLTAESVALMAGKPLLSIGVSDIGIEGDRVEGNLQKVFDLAGKWEAVLLFDEADVFLEARGEGENDLKRNAMVSVLLRVLEYYDGILILTTNRMRSFDIAVQSRIHIAIKYEELTTEQKVNIFTSFLDQLQKKKLVHTYGDLMQWVNKEGKKLQLNGRQIRNVVSTALGLALMDTSGQPAKLRPEHLKQVAEQTKNFKQDLSTQEGIYMSRHK